ncbi:hypothetical protein BDZ91DRAFT_718674 [Kalaharituber pfeilii]|nr:hypothetical protein BDZ91DRAFT_718674 [Kalaharituber pfeilii]
MFLRGIDKDLNAIKTDGYQPDNLHVCTSLFFFSHFFCPKLFEQTFFPLLFHDAPHNFPQFKLKIID